MAEFKVNYWRRVESDAMLVVEISGMCGLSQINLVQAFRWDKRTPLASYSISCQYISSLDLFKGRSGLKTAAVGVVACHEI